MKKNKRGFTLTEILIVIVIIGIIISIAIPSVVAIRKRINERLLESKKDIILVAAELYGEDRNISVNTIIHVYDLLNSKYIDADVPQNTDNCTGDNTENGCVINPVNNSSLNDKTILIKRTGKNVIAIWEGTEGNTSSRILVEIVKDQLGCTHDDVVNGECIYTDTNSGSNPNNYLYYSGVMWRVIGVYYIDSKEVAKLITDDNVVWEVEA